MIVVLQRINSKAKSKVDRKRAELGLRYRYPEARGELWETQKYTQVCSRSEPALAGLSLTFRRPQEEIKEAERLGYGQPVEK